jgi:hypothetical protein
VSITREWFDPQTGTLEIRVGLHGVTDKKDCPLFKGNKFCPRGFPPEARVFERLWHLGEAAYKKVIAHVNTDQFVEDGSVKHVDFTVVAHSAGTCVAFVLIHLLKTMDQPGMTFDGEVYACAPPPFGNETFMQLIVPKEDTAQHVKSHIYVVADPDETRALAGLVRGWAGDPDIAWHGEHMTNGKDFTHIPFNGDHVLCTYGGPLGWIRGRVLRPLATLACKFSPAQGSIYTPISHITAAHGSHACANGIDAYVETNRDTLPPGQGEKLSRVATCVRHLYDDGAPVDAQKKRKRKRNE